MKIARFFPILCCITIACSAVTSDEISTDRKANVCESGGVYYGLPIWKLQASVTIDPAQTPRTRSIEVTPVGASPDPEASYCLRRIDVAIASDRIAISAPNGLLGEIYSRNEDRTVSVVENLTKAAATFVTAGSARIAQAIDGGKPVYGPYIFNPFDASNMEEINAALRPFGYCIHLDSRDDPYVPDWSPTQCGRVAKADRPRSVAAPASSSAIMDSAAEYPAHNGLFYRPLLTHRLVISRMDDPEATEEIWRTEKMMAVKLPNAAPTFEVSVDRSLFVTMSTNLKFTDGVLTDASVKKEGSEASELLGLPLKIAGTIFDLPTNILKLRIADTNNRIALIQANTQLLQALSNLEDAEELDDETRRESDIASLEQTCEVKGTAQDWSEAEKATCLALAQQCIADGKTKDQCEGEINALRFD